MQGCAGNVLNALHQINQVLRAVCLNRGEAHPAVTHDNRADTVAC